MGRFSLTSTALLRFSSVHKALKPIWQLTRTLAGLGTFRRFRLGRVVRQRPEVRKPVRQFIT